MQSFQNDNSELKDMQKYIETKLANIEELTTKTTKAMYGLSLLHVEEGLEEVNKLLNIGSSDALITAHKELFKEVNKCIDDVNTNIHTTIAKFAQIEEKVNLFSDAINRIRKESPEYEMDEVMEFLRQIYQSTIDPYITQLLTQLKDDSFSLPMKVKKCVEGLTMIVPLFLKSDKQITEMTSAFERLFQTFADEKNKLSTKINEECSFYILEGLKKVKELSTQREKYEQISSTITECQNEGTNFLKQVDTKFTEILDEAQRIAENSSKGINIHGPTLDDMSDQYDDFMEDFKGQLDSTTVKAFLKQLKQDSISVPKKVKKCVDEAVYSLWASSVKLEL